MVSATTHFAAFDAEPLFPSGPPTSWLPAPARSPPPRTIPARPRPPSHAPAVPDFPDERAGDGEGTGGGGGGAATDPSVDAGVEELKKHARAAVAIEFTTIPMYLYATWSIKGDNGGPGSKARYCILGIVQQEMLHLSLAGNILRALGGDFKLYDPEHMPIYDDKSKLLFDEVDLHLEPAEKHLLGTFVKVEAPWTPPQNVQIQNQIHEALGISLREDNIAPTYHSIGDFYKQFGEGLETVYEKDKTILSHNPTMQFGPDDFFGSDMVIIKNLKTAQEAMTTIVDQGEGAIGVEDSHYKVFLDLYEKRDTWDCFPVAKNPKTVDYKTNEYLYRLCLAMDAAYCYLLRIIDDIWYDPAVAGNRITRHWLIRSMHPLMMDVFPPLAGIIVAHPWKEGTAGPAFNFYPQGGQPLTRAQLQKAVLSELDAALKTEEGQAGGMKAKLQAIRFSMANITPEPGVHG